MSSVIVEPDETAGLDAAARSAVRPTPARPDGRGQQRRHVGIQLDTPRWDGAM
jgi:hypothetical protein